MTMRQLLIRITLPVCALLLAFPAPADVDELIAQFPAENAGDAGRLFDALLAEGDAAIAGLCDRLVPMGEGDDNAERYALTGLARYASRPDAGNDQDIVEDALLAGLEQARDPEVQAYLLRQLQQCGSNASIGAIRGLVENSLVASHAILALDAIDTWRARRALAGLLNDTRGQTQIEVLSALADNGSNWRVTRAIRERLETNPETDEYVHLLSILVAVAGDNATRDLIAAMDQNDPRIRKAAFTHAGPLLDDYAARKWRKKVRNKDLPDAVKREIGAFLVAEGVLE